MGKSIAAGLAMLLLAGCAGNAGPGEVGFNKSTGGALLGAGAGALAGSQIGQGEGAVLGTVLGGFLGAIAGNEAGKSMDRADRLTASRPPGTVTPVGIAPSTWRNPDAATAGTTASPPAPRPWHNPDAPDRTAAVPAPPTAAAEAAPQCREYQETVTIGGKPQQVHGTACREPDGTWRIRR